MNIEDLLSQVNQQLESSKRDGFKMSQESASWGIVAGVMVSCVTGILVVLSFQAALETREWHYSALTGYCLHILVDNGIGCICGAIAKLRGLERTDAKREIVGL